MVCSWAVNNCQKEVHTFLNTKEFPRLEKTKEIQNTKEWKIRVVILLNAYRTPRLESPTSTWATVLSEKNAAHPKTQTIDHWENLRFRVCCVFGCSLFSSKGAPKHTWKSNTPEIADSGNCQLLAFSGALTFWVCFGACQIWNKELYAKFKGVIFSALIAEVRSPVPYSPPPFGPQPLPCQEKASKPITPPPSSLPPSTLMDADRRE